MTRLRPSTRDGELIATADDIAGLVFQSDDLEQPPRDHRAAIDPRVRNPARQRLLARDAQGRFTEKGQN